MSLTPPACPKPLRRGEGPALSPLVPRGERSPRTLIAPCALEPPSGPLTPSLSPSEGERVPEGRERGGSWAGNSRQARVLRTPAWQTPSRVWPRGHTRDGVCQAGVRKTRAWRLFPAHEPPLSRPSGTLSPSEGERDGVRGPLGGSRAQGAIKVRGDLSLLSTSAERATTGVVVVSRCARPAV